MLPSASSLQQKSEGSRRLGFTFVPLPQAVMEAVAEGALDAINVLILAFLWRRADFDSRTAKATLVQLAEGTGWNATDNGLYQRLRKLRRDGWLSWETTPGRAGARYDFRLAPTPEKPSGQTQSSADEIGQTSAELETPVAPARAARMTGERSEQPEAEDVEVAQSRARRAQSSENGANRLQERDDAERPAPVTQSVPEGPEVKAGIEEKDLSSIARSQRDPLASSPSPFQPPASVRRELEKPFGFDLAASLLAVLRVDVPEAAT